ncbi:hypothetical protein HKCCE2091_10485 [Rhodobacterales bacterium HKCCE2091]|nr:hypothetical protein [Rhodobacterales bacterium HKCCE2091]
MFNSFAKYVSRLVAAGVFAGMAGSASATVISFDDLDFCLELNCTHVEGGFEVTPVGNGDFGDFTTDDALHFDISPGSFIRAATVARLDGNLFGVTGLDVIPLGPLTTFAATQPFVRFTGLRNGLPVAMVMGGAGSGPSFSFGTGFANIDSLLIEGVLTPDMDPIFADYHFDIDNIRISAVPLPLGGALLASGIFALGLYRRRGTA